MKFELPPARCWTCPRCATQWRLLPVVKKPVCPHCEEADLERKARLPLSVLLRQAGVPGRYRRGVDRTTWAKRFRRPWPRQLAAWDGEPSMVLLWGQPGTGKTGAATIVLTEWVREGKTACWVRAGHLLDTARESLGKGAGALQAWRRLRKQVRTAEILVLDDLAAGNPSRWAVERMLDVLAERYDEMRPTLVTSMADPAHLGTLDAGLASRLVAGLQVPLGGEDQRVREGGA